MESVCSLHPYVSHYHTYTNHTTAHSAMSLKRTVKPDGKAAADNNKRRRIKTALELPQKLPPFRLAASSAPADVEIAVFDHVYHLHAISLRNCSKVFDNSLSDTWWKPENTHNGEDGIKYRYKLVVDVKDPMMSMLEPMPPQRVSFTFCIVIKRGLIC